jgi:tetratricopeptide (TPR) repeat protein
MGLAWLLNVRGELAWHRGDYLGAIALLEQSLALFRSLDDRWYVAMVLNNMGALARGQADISRATTLYEESLAMTRELGDTWSMAMILGNMGEVARDQGDIARAVALCEESLGLFRQLGDQRRAAFALTCLGVVARGRGEYQPALALYAESLALLRSSNRWSRLHRWSLLLYRSSVPISPETKHKWVSQSTSYVSGSSGGRLLRCGRRTMPPATRLAVVSPTSICMICRCRRKRWLS